MCMRECFKYSSHQELNYPNSYMAFNVLFILLLTFGMHISYDRALILCCKVSSASSNRLLGCE